ncbi:MAG: NADH-quinone oxidoreductase subunit N, partial [Deltaproteobacteria bacterium]
VAISAFQGRGTALAANHALMFYLWAYLFMNLGAFAVVTAVVPRDESGDAISAFDGLADRSPLLALAMALFLVSLAGIPPTAGFTAKLYLFGTALRAKLYPLAIIGVLNSVISVYYYLRVVVHMYMRPAPEGASAPFVSGGLAVTLLLCAYATLHLGIFSQGMLHFTTLCGTLLGLK